MRIQHQDELGLGSNDRRDAGRAVAFPVGPREQVRARTGASRARPDVREVERVPVHELRVIEAILVDRGHCHNERFGPEISADERIGRVGVGRLNSLVSRGVDARGVIDLVPGRLVLRVRAVLEIRVLNAVVVHEREAVDVGVPRDFTNLRRLERLRAAGGRQQRAPSHHNPHHARHHRSQPSGLLPRELRPGLKHLVCESSGSLPHSRL